ncbi:MAG: phytochelatin synthase family protein [Bdellovibrionota bacterium]
MKTLYLLAFSLFVIICNAEAKPKYGESAELLRYSHEYLRENAAADYWALSPYYIGTPGECACSTSITMIVNAARNPLKLTSDDKLVTAKALLEEVKTSINWKARIDSGKGVSLHELPIVLGDTLKHFKVAGAKLEVVQIQDLSDATLEKVRKDLLENEKTDKNFIVANFNQGAFTGDADAGHLSPVGAYDQKRGKVLIFDTDREWYEPYWVSEQTFIRGMATLDQKSGKFRGYVKVLLK